MKKYGLAILLTMLFTHSVMAAESGVPAETAFQTRADAALKAKLPPDIQKRGYIIAGTNPNTPPTTFYKEDNKTLSGREIDIMTAIAEKLGVKVQWHDTGGFDNIIPGLKSKRYEVALANINATPKRLEQVDFVSYFNASRLGIISHKDAGIAPFTQLIDVCGKEVGAGAGTTQLTRLNDASKTCEAQGKSPIKIAVFPDRPSGVQAVVSGRVPMFFGPYEGLTWQVNRVKALTMSGQIGVDDASISIALQQHSPLTEPVRLAINALIQDGTYQKILDSWSIGYGALQVSKSNEEVF